MQSRSAAYLTIMANAAHTVEWRVTINGTVYGQDKLVYSAGGGNGAPRLTRQMFSGTQPEVGRAVSAQFTCAVMEASSAIPRMASVVPAYRIAAGSSASEWITLGTFYIDTRQTDKVTGALMLNCYDRMLVADGIGGASYADLTGFDEWPQSMGSVVSEIASIIGVTIDSRTSIGSGTGYMVEYPNDLSMREVLGFIAAANAGNWCITPANALRLVPLTGGNGSLSLAADVVGLKTSPAFAPWSGVEVYWDDEESYDAGTDTGRVLTCDCPWATQATANGILTAISGSSYQPYTADGAVIDMALELGDVVTVGLTGSTVTGPVFGIDIRAGLIEQATITAPGEDEIDHEYPYTSYVDRSLRRKVSLGQSYYGTSISREKGIEITRSDGKSRAIFNSDLFTMQALVNGVLVDKLYFNPELGQYVFDGLLASDAMLTDVIYAQTGEIAELTVDRLSTSKRIRMYNLGNTSDDNHIVIQDNYLRFMTGSVKCDENDPTEPLTEQAYNRNNQYLYWQKEPVTYNAQGYPFDENGVQVYTTTEETDWPVMQYQYTEQVKAQIAFELENGTYVPIFTIGAGDENGRNQGYIHKSATGLDILYSPTSGSNIGIKALAEGFLDLYGVRRTTSLDLHNFPSGFFQAIMDGNLSVNYGVNFDSNGDPVRIYDSAHSMDVIWW